LPHPLSLSRALKRERGTHREAMGGEGVAGVVAHTTLTRPPSLRYGGHPLPLQSAGEGRIHGQGRVGSLLSQTATSSKNFCQAASVARSKGGLAGSKGAVLSARWTR